MSDIRLVCGDCLQVMTMLEDHSIDAVITDPPYLIGSIGGRGFAGTKLYNSGVLDDMISLRPTEFLDIVRPKMRTMNLVACCSRDQLAIYAAWSVAHSYTFDVHVWHKTDAPPFINGCFKSDLEYIVLIYEPGRTFINGKPQAEYSKLYQSATNKKANKYGHPTTKPLELICKYVDILTKSGETVLDPFMGSGTTALACMPGRSFIGIEIDATYYATSERRVAAAQAQLRMPL